MPVARTVRRTLRGPVRDRLRLQQARTPLLRGGRVGGPPDFVGIGVQRCGTSWWHGLIESHPAVTPLGFGAKELHFFDDLWAGDVDDARIERYHSHFLRGAGQLAGEWTPRYLYDPWVLPLVLRAAPQARLLVMVRDPVARFRSGMKHARKLGRGLDADVVTGAYERGLYAAQLQPLLEVVPRSQLLVLQLERCIRDTRPILDATFDFLGLEPAAVPITPALNAIDEPMPLGDGLVEQLRLRYREDVDRLAGLFPDDIDPALWAETMS